jgi:hypothetical protein
VQTCEEYQKQPFKEMLEEQMMLATNLKLQNVEICKKWKIDKTNLDKVTERNVKLEKFYQKEKAKKYRNCGT